MKAIKMFLVMFVILIMGCNKNPDKSSETEAVPVQTTRVSSALLTKPVRAIGRLLSSEQIKLSFKTGGIIDKIYVQEGQRVEKGKLIAVLKMDEIQAHFASAESGFKKAERDYQRLKKLYEDKAVTLSQYQDAETALKLAQANYEIAKFNLENSRIFSPENGYILKQLAEENEVIGTGHPVFVFGSDQEMWEIHSSVTDRDVVRIKTGDSASATIDAYPEYSFSGCIISVGNAPDPDNGNYEIELSIYKQGYTFFNGLICRVTIFPSEYKECCVIPTESVVQGEGMEGFVFRIDAENKAEKIPIEIDHFRVDSVAVLKGLEKGEKIISRGAAYVKEGDLVKDMSKINDKG